MQEPLEAELNVLLAEDRSLVTKRLRGEFDRIVGDSGMPLVLFGAGMLGQRTLNGLRRAGIEPLALTDNNPKLWHQPVNGLRVLPPAEAVKQFNPQAVFVVTIYNPSAVRHQLQQMGCRLVVPACPLFWKYADQLLPHGALDDPAPIFEHGEEIRTVLRFLSDELSRKYFVSQLQWRLDLDSDRLPRPCPAKDTYFPDDIVLPLKDEVFVDCGAYDGDSIRPFVERRNGEFMAIVGIEPDPANFERLQAYRSGLQPAIGNKLFLNRIAAASSEGVISFDAQNDMSSNINASGTTTLECGRLDRILADHPPTYLKMDIEGAELDALEGARQTIAAHHPVLAICAYHKQDDLWRIPLAIKSLYAGYRLFLRIYAEDCWEIVCYAVPEERLVR